MFESGEIVSGVTSAGGFLPTSVRGLLGQPASMETSIKTGNQTINATGSNLPYPYLSRLRLFFMRIALSLS